METLAAHSPPDIRIPAAGVAKHLEMLPPKPSASAAIHPATRINSVILDDTQQPPTRTEHSFQAAATSNLSPDASSSYHSTPPAGPQDGNVGHDASRLDTRVHTPEPQSYSQTSLKDSPARHKRTASGLLKPVDTPAEVRPRAESVSSSGSKAGEVAAQLKTRLAYAMAKVQHGWEHRNINEVEQLAAALPPRTAASPAASSAPIDIRSPPAKRRSASGVVSWSLPESHPVLAPPVTLSASQNSNSSRRPLLSSSPTHVPSTPKSRPTPIHSAVPTQQAEQDAMDALMLMGGSPGNAGKFPTLSQSSSSQNAQQSQSQSQQYRQPPINYRRSESLASLVGRSPNRPTMLSRNNSSTSEVSVANSEVREARKRLLDEVEESA